MSHVRPDELARTLALVRAALDATTDALCVTDTGGTITDYNRNFLEMWKIEGAEVDAGEFRQTRTHFSAHFPDPDAFAARIEQISVEAPGDSFDLLALHDGRQIERSSNLQVVDGQNAGRVWSFRDVTEAKRLQLALGAAEVRHRQLLDSSMQRTAALEAANGELESFTYSVSHDLRAPLRAVDGFSQAVLEDFGAQLPEEARRYLLTIRQGTQRMGLLIDDLLMFSRHGRLPLHKRVVDMRHIVQSALDELDSQRAGRRIEVKIGPLPACSADPALLKQVWINLLSNAFKYTRHCDIAMIEIGCKAMPEGSVYFIADNGAGFDMRYVEKLFGVFQRLHRAEDYEGSGVGLAIVQRVILRHGGRIWADARVDGGATFYFTMGEELKK